MPVVLLLDTSLPMARALPGDGAPRFAVAQRALSAMADHLEAAMPLEPCAFATLSDALCVTADFAPRGHRAVRRAVEQAALRTRARLGPALLALARHVSATVGPDTPCHAVLVIDGYLDDAALAAALPQLTVLAPRLTLHVCVLAVAATAAPPPPNLRIYARRHGGDVTLAADSAAVTAFVQKLATGALAAWRGELAFGLLSSTITLHPAPPSSLGLPPRLDISCFVPLDRLQSPPLRARFLIQSLVSAKPVSAPAKNAAAPQPDFRGLLFATLLQERSQRFGLAGIIRVRQPNLFALVHLCTSSDGNNTQLALSLLTPGSGLLPWLGAVSQTSRSLSIQPPPPAVEKSVGLLAGGGFLAAGSIDSMAKEMADVLRLFPQHVTTRLPRLMNDASLLLRAVHADSSAVTAALDTISQALRQPPRLFQPLVENLVSQLRALRSETIIPSPESLPDPAAVAAIVAAATASLAGANAPPAAGGTSRRKRSADASSALDSQEDRPAAGSNGAGTAAVKSAKRARASNASKTSKSPAAATAVSQLADDDNFEPPPPPIPLKIRVKRHLLPPPPPVPVTADINEENKEDAEDAYDERQSSSDDWVVEDS